jgi:hypothetical protein
MIRLRIRRWVSIVVIAVLVITTTGFQAVAQEVEPGEKGSAEAMIGDLVIVRPLGITATALGAVFFVASLPFSLAGLNTEAAFERLVAEPAEFTFARALGDVDY